jgi:DNA-binding transcriptional MerR regulator
MGEVKLEMTHKEAADLLELAPQTLHKLNSAGLGPKRKKRGKYLIYHIKDLSDWLNSRTREIA